MEVRRSKCTRVHPRLLDAGPLLVDIGAVSRINKLGSITSDGSKTLVIQ